MEFKGFETISFPENLNIIYILGIDFKRSFMPFYVGQTSRNIGRFGDYLSSKFSASTDFKVGEAVKYLTRKGYKVKIKFKGSKSKEKEEKDLINKLREVIILLNDLPGYNYKIANENIERRKIQCFVDKFVERLNRK